MNTIIINSQEEFNKILEVKKDEEIIFKNNKIKVNNVISVYGILRLEGEINCNYYENRYLIGRENGIIHNESWGSSQVHNVSWESSQVHNESWGSSQVHNESWESSQVHNVSRGSSQVHNVSRESSQVHNESWESSQVHNESWESSQVHNDAYNFSVISIPKKSNIKVIKHHDTVCVQEYFIEEDYFKREGIDIKNDTIIIFKRVSVDYKTQENKDNEILWSINTVVTHKAWNPQEQECGKGKFHACSRPYFCDDFRNGKDDKYIAIEVKVEDTYQWKNPQYIHKIGFREGHVLYECDRYGNKKE